MPSVNKKLVLAKMLFFCTAMSGVGWSRFQNNFYLDMGMSPAQIGFLKSIGLIFKFFMEPLLCFLSDIYSTKIVFVLCMTMQVLTMEILRVIRPLSFSILVFVKILRTTTAPSATLTTVATLILIEGSSQGFGKQRMFGSLAWGIGAVTAGALIDHFGMNGVFFYTYFFNLFSLLFIWFGLPDSQKPLSSPAVGMSSSFSDRQESIGKVFHRHSLEVSVNSDIYAPADEEAHNLLDPSFEEEGMYKTGSSHAMSPWKSIRHQLETLGAFFKDPNCFYLLLNAFFYGIVMTVPETFLYLSLEKDFGATRTYSGFCTAASIISCLPLFWYSDELIDYFGHSELIFWSQLLAALRMLLYLLSYFLFSSQSVLVAILFIQLLHGFNFALYWACIVDLISQVAPEGLRSSCLSVVNIVFFTLAAGCGNLLWGFIYQYSDNVWNVYLLSSILGLITCSLYRFRGIFSHLL